MFIRITYMRHTEAKLFNLDKGETPMTDKLHLLIPMTAIALIITKAAQTEHGLAIVAVLFSVSAFMATLLHLLGTDDRRWFRLPVLLRVGGTLALAAVIGLAILAPAWVVPASVPVTVILIASDAGLMFAAEPALEAKIFNEKPSDHVQKRTTRPCSKQPCGESSVLDVIFGELL